MVSGTLRADTRRVIRSAVFIGLLLSLAPVSDAASQTVLHESSLTLEIWTERDRIIHPEGSPEERLLQELRYVVSGMVYGYRFAYTPSWGDRNVAERFLLEPAATIPWGDSAATTLDLADRGNTVYGQFMYNLSHRQRSLRSRWDSATVPDSSGSGSANIMDGYSGKIDAMEEAIHQALRVYLRGETRNRPREVTGAILLEEAPRVFIDEGRYVARVDIRILIDTLLPYETF